MKKAHLAAPVLALLLVAPLLAQSAVSHTDDPTEGSRIEKRTKADAALMLPQACTGGSDKVALEHDQQTQTELDVDGCDELTAHISKPAKLDKDGKYALVLAINGQGYDTPNDIKSAARLSNSRDPIIFASLSYSSLRRVSDDFSVIEALVDRRKLEEAYSWLLKTMLEDANVDPERVFLFGGRGSNQLASEFARSLWQADKKAFPFRACLYDGPIFSFDVDGAPAVGTAFSITDFDLQMFKDTGYTTEPSVVANKLMARGIPCEYHSFKADLFNPESDRLMQVHRAVINRLGGPGAEEYPPEENRYLGAFLDADKVPFEETEDPWMNEVVLLVKAEKWQQALTRGTAILKNKRIKSKAKRGLKGFMKDLERYCKKECERLNKSIESSIEHDFWPNTWHHERLKGMQEAFGGESWFKRKKYNATLETLKTFGPAQRDQARKARMFEAIELELAGKRDEAKKIYREIVKQLTDDGGVSVWPHAAEYRLSWWRGIE